MTTYLANTPNVTQYALLLYTNDKTSRALLGAWGSYSSEEQAQRTQEELMTWPIRDGEWEIVPLKTFSGSREVTFNTATSPMLRSA